MFISARFSNPRRAHLIPFVLSRPVFFPIVAALFAAFLMVFAIGAGAQERRVALVIGNSSYSNVPQLPNPANDAQDLAITLRRIGFEVSEAIDLDYRAMRIAVRDFSEQAENADIALLYYAGHGIEIENTNYLIPVNAQLKRAADVEFEALRLDAVLSSLAAPKGLKIVLIDACRDNPFRVTMRQSGATRSVGRGLARIEPTGVVVGYAAKGGTYALDGAARNSPYAEALMEHLETPGLELGKLFRKVRDSVYAVTGQQQEPFVYGSLPGHDIFLVDPLPVVMKPQAPVSPQQLNTGPVIDEQVISHDFALTSDQKSVPAWRSFLLEYEDHPEHPLVDLAGQRLAALILDQDIARGYRVREPWLKSAIQPDGVTVKMSLSDRRLVQHALNMMGFNTGGVDGQFGPRTRKAIGKARSLAGLEPGTNVDLALLRILPNVEAVRSLQSDKARLYQPEDLPEDLEPRLRKALLALKGKKLIFDYFDGHLYLVVSTKLTGATWKFKSGLAEKAGGYQVAIGSRQENEFLVNLFSRDEIFITKEWNGHQFGPNIGLHQVDRSQEPDGGWEWANGDPLTFKAWSPGNPDNHRGMQHIARFWLKSKMNGPGATVKYWDDGMAGYGNSFIIEIE